MPEIEMLCIANSEKLGGRCVAGMRLDDKSLIRPVSDTKDGELNASACQLNVGRAVQPLDVVRVGLRRPEPRRHQPENWIATDKQWVLVDQLTPQTALLTLQKMSVEGPNLFGTCTDHVTWAQIQESGVQASLAIVKAVAPKFFPRKGKRRAAFDLRGTCYDLSIKFHIELPADGKRIHRSQASWYFTISLGEPLPEKDNACFKLIAGAIEIPAGS
ncbi:MAG: hypothetical protein KTU85_11765 [Acidimicrobiia bacterium]|nr:hypothetical protein [Acidimicrobiia bacterium]